MHIGKQNPGLAYKLDGEPMQEVREEKDLNILIDNKLKFHKQTAAAISKASQMLAVIRHSFANINEFTLPLLTVHWKGSEASLQVKYVTLKLTSW